MRYLKLVPLFLSCLLLGAHFLRANSTLLVISVLLLPCLLVIKQQWSTRLVQLCLILGAVEWLRTLAIFIAERQEIGESWIRLAFILGFVALCTGLSALPLTSIQKAHEKGRK